MKSIVVGSLESSDCLITLRYSKERKIQIESPVYDAFYKQINAVIIKTLTAHNLDEVEVICQDKGALDYAIKARLETAIKRFKEA